MFMRHRGSICATALAVALVSTPVVAQKVDFGKYPDFRGKWERALPGSPNNWKQQGGAPPLTPEYQKVYAASLADQKNGGPGNWPSTFCIPPGMPAMMNLYNPMEMIITPSTTYILISHDNDSYRRIYTDGRDWPTDPERTYAGYSIGHWVDEDGDGKYDALEVETRFLKNPRAYENSGIPFDSDGQTRITERFHLDKNNRNIIYDDIMVYDHALTRPWGKVQVARRTNAALRSEDCPADNQWVKIGDEFYMKNIVDGKLMPTRPGEPPPDLSHFK
jgi:hypothetical protein